MQELLQGGFERKTAIEIQIEPGFESFFPKEFKRDPFGYFDQMGENIKPGNVRMDASGIIREDPTSVKVFPSWCSQDGREICVVGKRINPEKGKVGISGNPFYECEVLSYVRERGVPTSELIAKIQQEKKYLFLMKRVEGLSWYEALPILKERGFSEEEIDSLREEARIQMNQLKEQCKSLGIQRGWKLQDMIFDVDFEGRKLKRLIPVDWERTRMCLNE